MARKALLMLSLGIASAASLGVPTASAQWQPTTHVIEISPFVGYQFGGGVPVVNGEVTIGDAQSLGLVIDYVIQHDLQLEFMYGKQETEMRLKEFPFGNETTLSGMSVSYYQGGVLYVIDRGEFMPFATMTGGVTHFDPKESDFRSDWLFSLGLGLGVKMISPSGLGLRLEGRLLLSVVTSGTRFWVGTGGAGLAVGGAGLGQGNVSAALVFAF